MSTAIEVRLDSITTEHPAKYPHIVKQYADLLRRGYKFQPILCRRRDDGLLVIIDGHHRHASYVLAGRETIFTFIH